MPDEAPARPRTDTPPLRCAAVVARLVEAYGWQLEAPEREALALQLAALHGADAEERTLEQSCCRLRFATLLAELHRGGEPAERALAELFAVRWIEGESGTEVRYGGFLFRSALVTLRRRLAGSGPSPADYEQLAADAATRALTSVRSRFQDCRDPDAFWGWTARVAERAAIDELRSGRASGGSSVHALPLDDLGRLPDGSEPLTQSEERRLDAIAVRQELLRKCRLGRLSLDQREALVRSFWGGEKPQEIAAALTAERAAPVTAAQVSLWKHRGLQVMEANLRSRGYGGEGGVGAVG